jgi:NADPH2 dehydrogenase
VPGIVTVGSGYSYLQQWLPNVAQAAVRRGMTDIVGVARMHLAYPGLIADSLSGRPLDLAAIAAAF